jgi:hypothetical protein|tara:strand:- start:146 stop:331 length:186 start_codon:yes stop_codon:yes gene_type:complete
MKRKPKWDGRSRVSNDTYRKRWDEIFKKKGSVVNTEHSYVSREYTEEEQKLLDEIEDRNGF